MKKAILCVIMLLLVSTGASAESSAWKVQKGTSVIYLGGTIHILRDSDYPLPAEFDKAYKASEIIVFETDIGKLRDSSMQQKLLAQAMYTDGSTVKDHLSAQAYSDLSAFCESDGLTIDMLKQFKPSIIISMLEAVEFLKLGYTPDGVDSFFYGQANKDHKTIEELETPEEQISYVVSMADGIEDDFVTYSINDMKNIKEQFEVLENAWRKGDTEKIALMDVEVQTKLPRLYKKLFTDRNNKWLSLIQTYMNTPKTEFILVGAAHLAGPEGIIARLKKMGYTVDKL